MSETPETVALLLVEDNPGDATLIRRYLSQSNFTDMEAGVEVTHVETLTEAREHHAYAAFDVVFLDLGLPASTGLETVERFLADDPDLPMVVLTGLDDRNTAVQAIEMGAQDYLVKDKIDGYTISRSLRYAIQRFERTRELQRRKRELEQALTLNRAIQDIAVQSRTRNDIELAFCRRLVEEPGRRFAWVGEPDKSGVLEPRVVAGPDDGYLEEVDLDLDRSATVPSAAAATSHEPQFVSDLDREQEPAWRALLADRGVGSVAALPLTHDEVSYGVLTVYATDADAFDERERELLVDIAGMLSSSIERAELRTALTSDRVVEVELQLSGRGHYLCPVATAVASDVSGPAIEVLATIPHDETGVWQFLSVQRGAEERVRSRLADLAPVLAVEHVDTAEDAVVFRVHVDERTPESLLGDHGGAVRGTAVDRSVATVVVEFPEDRDVRRVVETLEAEFGPVSLQRYQKQDVEHDRPTALDRCGLTEKQAAALRTAFRYGYFDETRDHYAEDIAEALDVSRTTFQKHLRTAQRKVFGELLDGDKPA